MVALQIQQMKPVIFFSHSSRDRDMILPIRDRLLEGTGNSIDIFMSSDGSSIPFGHNWLKTIEDALVECKLMFVWMTPTSVNSSWIPFESGHAYARGISVIPIGFLGVELGSLPAPISILQGFNVSSADGLNNIITIINRDFGRTFPRLFNSEFYFENLARNSLENSPKVLRYVTSILFNYSPFLLEGKNNLIRKDWLGICRSVLADQNISFSEGINELFGAGFRISAANVGNDRATVYVRIDPLALNTTRKIWTEIQQRIYEDQSPPNLKMEVFLRDEWELADDGALIGARLLNSDVSFDTSIPHVVYKYRNIQFGTGYSTRGRGGEKNLYLHIPLDNELPIPLYSLVSLLDERRVIEVLR